jgi:hypothetical protein
MQPGELFQSDFNEPYFFLTGTKFFVTIDCPSEERMNEMNSFTSPFAKPLVTSSSGREMI